MSDGLHGLPDHLDQLYKDGHITANIYHQCLVSLAHRYMCDDHDAESALITLNRVPADYYLTTIKDHMAQDQSFAAAVVELAYKLTQLGLTTGLDSHTTNMLPAEA